ncbi:MAG: hypothetical protein U9R50_10055 [Campylobacterota bacterium]|nr:hypothetical protein [Campylobacterota bacterium]
MKNRPALVILTSIFLIVMIIHLFGWWEALGLIFLKFGLGANIAGAKTFAHAIIKVGGKKALALATTGMLAKRHIIDIFSKFFTEHSVNRYKKNLINVIKKKLDELLHSPPLQRIRAFGATLLSIPIVYFFWTKVLGTAIQKFVYALVVPLFSMLWNLLSAGFNILSFIFKVLMLNVFFDALSHYSWGKQILSLIDAFLALIGKVFSLFNTLLESIGLHPKRWLIRLSQKFNRYLESILDSGLSHIEKVQNRRDRYINTIETISVQRFSYMQKKSEKKLSFWRQTRNLYQKKILKKKGFREIRALRQEQKSIREEKTVSYMRKINFQKKRERISLQLPFK